MKLTVSIVMQTEVMRVIITVVSLTIWQQRLMSLQLIE